MIVFTAPRNPLKAALALVVAAALSGCALSPFDEDSGLRQVTTAIGTTGKLVEPQPFVRTSRPAEQTYPPVGITPAPHSIPVKAAAGVNAMEAELNALKAANDKAAAAPKPASPLDGKVEPGFKPPPQAPIPAYTGPKIDTPATAEAAKATADAAAPKAAAKKPQPKKSTAQKPKDKKAAAQSDKPKT